MEKVFVTGANGMLGSSICRELIKQGYLVKAFCLPNDTVNSIKELPIEFSYGNILNKEMLRKEIDGCDFVIHVAAMTTIWPRRNELVKKVNITGTQNVMEAAEELGIKRMVHIGSASSFNHGSIDNPGNEKSEYCGWKHKMDYLDSKYTAQELLLKRYKTHAFPVVIINPTFMIGPFDSGPSSGAMIISFYKDSLPGVSDGGKNFVCSADVACAAVNALTKGETGQCYIAGNENLKFKEFFTKVAKVLNKESKLKKIPLPVILFIGASGSVIARVIKRKPKISFGMAKFSGINQYYNPGKAVKELNMPQTPIETGIKQSIEWFKNNGYLS